MIAREILERIFERFLLDAELRNHAFEWESRETLVGLMVTLPGPLTMKERSQRCTESHESESQTQSTHVAAG